MENLWQEIGENIDPGEILLDVTWVETRKKIRMPQKLHQRPVTNLGCVPFQGLSSYSQLCWWSLIFVFKQLMQFKDVINRTSSIFLTF